MYVHNIQALCIQIIVAVIHYQFIMISKNTLITHFDRCAMSPRALQQTTSQQ